MPIVSGRQYRSALDGLSAEAPSQDSSQLVITGRAISFDSPALLPYEINGRPAYEVIERGALDGADLSDFIFNVEHQGRVYARTRNKSLSLTITPTEAFMRALLDSGDEGHRQLHGDVKAGRLDRMSFSFLPDPDGCIFDEAANTLQIFRIKKLYDVSAVAFPFYEDTSITARSAFLVEDYQQRTLEQRQRRARALAYTYTF